MSFLSRTRRLQRTVSLFVLTILVTVWLNLPAVAQEVSASTINQRPTPIQPSEAQDGSGTWYAEAPDGTILDVSYTSGSGLAGCDNPGLMVDLKKRRGDGLQWGTRYGNVPNGCLTSAYLVNLDNEPAPEMFLHFYSGGINCCSGFLLGDLQAYREDQPYSWRLDPFYTKSVGLIDANGDGSYEISMASEIIEQYIQLVGNAQFPQTLYKWIDGELENVSWEFQYRASAIEAAKKNMLEIEQRLGVSGLWKPFAERRGGDDFILNASAIRAKVEPAQKAGVDIRGPLASFALNAMYAGAADIGWATAVLLYRGADSDAFFEGLANTFDAYTESQDWALQTTGNLLLIANHTAGEWGYTVNLLNAAGIIAGHVSESEQEALAYRSAVLLSNAAASTVVGGVLGYVAGPIIGTTASALLSRVENSSVGQYISEKAKRFLREEAGTVDIPSVGARLGATAGWSVPIRIHIGQQGKHIVGHNNYVASRGRSIWTHPDPEGLLKRFAGKGRAVNSYPPGSPGYKENVDFGEVIGEYIDVDNPALRVPTTNGTIKYGKEGAHIVPARP